MLATIQHNFQELIGLNNDQHYIKDRKDCINKNLFL
jgi:hypothetical protein